MIKLGLTITAAMTADLVTFALLVPIVGIQAELNPIMAGSYSHYGLWAVILLKAVCTVMIIYLVMRVQRPKLRILAACPAIGFGLFGAFGNIIGTIVINAGRF